MQCPTQPIVAELTQLRLLEPEQACRIGTHRLGLPVDRLALDDDRTQQHPKGKRMRQRAATVGGGCVLIQQPGESEPLGEVVYEGKRPQPPGMRFPDHRDRSFRTNVTAHSAAR